MMLFYLCRVQGWLAVAQENPKKFSDLLAALRSSLPVWRERVREAVETAKEEPHVIWDHPARKWLMYGIFAIALLVGARMVTNWISPSLPAGASQTRAREADFRVICINMDCNHQFFIRRPFGFRAFPVACPSCHYETGERAVQCHSAKCKGAWVAPLPSKNGPPICPDCGSEMRVR